MTIKRSFPVKTEFEKAVIAEAEKEEYGGIKNAHVHGDRAYTDKDEFYASTGRSTSEFGKMSLPAKQQLTWRLHQGPAFEPESIEKRVRKLFDASIEFGVIEVATTVDVTYNTGHTSLEVMKRLREEYAEKGLTVRLGAYNTSGFKKPGVGNAEERIRLYEKAAEDCDFLMGLAEKDRNEEGDNGHIGERQHNWYLLELAHRLEKDIQFHVGQENRPTDRTLEILVGDIEQFQDLHLRGTNPGQGPQLTAVHAISTACHSDEEIDSIAKRMAKRNINLITCPRAAISMLQDRTIKAPIHNSIAPVMRMAANGVHIEGLGTDNVGDIYIPSGNPDPIDEMLFLAEAERIYVPRILGKMLAGAALDDYDRDTIKELKFPDMP